MSETLESVLQQNYEEWEALIINDGSIDATEAIALKYVNKDERFKYFKKTNGGLGTARNFGIEKAQGLYVLPLDSDNMVCADFVNKAVAILESHQEFGVVYGNAIYFGEREGFWNVGAFDKFKLLRGNYIDACAVIKKEVFEELGNYDLNIPHQGQEDWEFWLRVLTSRYTFYYLNELTFKYRVTSDSMIRSYNKDMRNVNEAYIKSKHANLYIKFYKQIYKKYKKLEYLNDQSLFKKVLKSLKKDGSK